MRLLAAGEKSNTGFPHLYYPGVAEQASASPIQLGPGQQAEADFSMTAVPLYQLAGSVSGQLPDQGVGIQVLTTSGDEISMPTNFNMELGTFSLEDVPAGSYILEAISQAGLHPLHGETKIKVTSNVADLHLALTPETSIPLDVRLDSRNSSATASPVRNQGRPPVSVRLRRTDVSGVEVASTFPAGGSGGLVLQNVEPGRYSVEVMPQPPWYVQTATYGPNNLLSDDITITAAGTGYPMEIVLRDDGASVSAMVKKSSDNNSQAAVLVVPAAASKAVPRVARVGTGEFTVRSLAPGEYLVFAFDRLDNLEYGSPEALQAFSSQAAHVTLVPNQRAQVVLELIHLGKGD